MHRFYRDWLGRGYVGLFYCGERTAKGSKVTGGEIQSRNDDPRRKPGGTRLKGDALSFPQPVLRNGTQWYAMVRNGNDGALPSFFAATEDRCGRVAHTPATANSYKSAISARINVGGSPTLLWRPTATNRRGSMWAGRPHSYGDRSPISLRIDCLVSASRSGKRLGSNAPNGASFKPKNSDAGSAPSELSDASPAKPRPCT